MGVSVGSPVGACEGGLVGTCVGRLVGFRVGRNVGYPEGTSVGNRDGAGDGRTLSVGKLVGAVLFIAAAEWVRIIPALRFRLRAYSSREKNWSPNRSAAAIISSALYCILSREKRMHMLSPISARQHMTTIAFALKVFSRGYAA